MVACANFSSSDALFAVPSPQPSLSYSGARLSRQQARVRSLDDPSKEVGDAIGLDEQVAWFEKNMIPDEAVSLQESTALAWSSSLTP